LSTTLVAPDQEDAASTTLDWMSSGRLCSKKSSRSGCGLPCVARRGQRLARFVRMTLSFSKSVVMHEAYLLLFLHRYNRDQAILLK
jgi:IS1 family transposase